jgi:hypothetical protein
MISIVIMYMVTIMITTIFCGGSSRIRIRGGRQ